MHTDYGPSYPKIHEHYFFFFFLTESFPKKTWKQTLPSGAHELAGLKIIVNRAEYNNLKMKSL